jgi:broad specificity phosphatase PhoE
MFEIDLIRHVKVSGKSALYGWTDIAPLEIDNEALLQRLISNQQTSNAYQRIICSPLQRCQTLASKLSQACHLPLEVNVDLQEMNFGLFDGVPFDDMFFDDINSDDISTNAASFEGTGTSEDELNITKNKNDVIKWSSIEAFFQEPAKVTLPEAERLIDFNHRVVRAWENIVVQQFSMITEYYLINEQQKPKKSRVLIIAHGGVIRMILAHLLRTDWQQASWHQNLQISNASLTKICISTPVKPDSGGDKPVEVNVIKSKQENYQDTSLLAHPLYQEFHSTVITIAMPLLQENHDKI